MKGMLMSQAFFFRYNIDMISRRDRIFIVAISCSVLVLVTLPYVIAIQNGDRAYIFNGFLVNPLDGNSYLAKMYQGWAGHWHFKLPFTSNPGSGAYLFLFYLGLGHLARLFGLPLLTIFHLSRLFGCFILLWTLWKFFGAFFDNARPRRLAFALASLGSGMGWLLLPVGLFTSDFWVVETYPFLSSYANPHFPIGLALVLWLVKPSKNGLPHLGVRVLTGIGTIVLSLINPFGVVITLMILGGNIIWLLITKSPCMEMLKKAVFVGLFGIPMLVYYLWVANTDPVFMGWNAQNLTPSPPVWDLVVSLSPALLFGFFGIVRYRKLKKDQRTTRIGILIIWAVLGLVLLYLPVGLQRRFMMGLYVPVAGLAALGVETLAVDEPRRYRLITICLFLLALPTNLIILMITQAGITTHDPKIYLSKAEFQTLSWIEVNTPPDALILSSPEMGLFIPAYTGRRVIYGHPFETINAEAEEAFVRLFFKGEFGEEQMRELIESRDVDYILFGPREKSLGEIHPSQDWQAVFSSGDVLLYKITDKTMP
jgi:hypothetical protein